MMSPVTFAVSFLLASNIRDILIFTLANLTFMSEKQTFYSKAIGWKTTHFGKITFWYIDQRFVNGFRSHTSWSMCISNFLSVQLDNSTCNFNRGYLNIQIYQLLCCMFDSNIAWLETGLKTFVFF